MKKNKGDCIDAINYYMNEKKLLNRYHLKHYFTFCVIIKS